MAKLSIILDMRTTDKEGRFPIKIRITCNRTNTTISTGAFVYAHEYIGTCECVVTRACENAKYINKAVRDIYYSYANVITELEYTGRIRTMSSSDIRNYVEHKKEYHSERTFTTCLEEYRKMCRTDKTQQTYGYTLQMMQRYKNKSKFTFEEIDYKFLLAFDKWMQDNNISTSSRSIVFRNMRAVFNYAINNDWVDYRSYPFRKFKIKQGNKEKVYLTEEKMRELLSLNLSGYNDKGLALARDFFVLSFLFCGINPVDLFSLPKQSEQITFVRQKIKFHEPQPIHIGIQPEAEYLISEYCGSKHLLCLAEKYYSFESCYHFMKHRLKKLGDMIGCPGITFYWARYSWATYASKIDIPDSTISKALGHADSTLAEKKYISFDWAKVDKANRRVIDYAIYGQC